MSYVFLLSNSIIANDFGGGLTSKYTITTNDHTNSVISNTLLAKNQVKNIKYLIYPRNITIYGICIIHAISEFLTYSENAAQTNYVTATEVIRIRLTLNKKLFIQVSLIFIG